MKNRVFIIAAVAAILMFMGIYLIRQPLQYRAFVYLSLNRPINAEVLVIEGWLTNRMFKEAAAEFIQGKYSYCLVVGRTHALRMPEHILMGYGIDSAVISSTSAKIGRHNTYYSALAARQWLRLHRSKVSTLNVFTAGPHGRKSWTIFKRVLGRNYTVGVISSSITSSDTDLWWESKQGARNMVKWGGGYLYALLWPFHN